VNQEQADESRIPGWGSEGTKCSDPSFPYVSTAGDLKGNICFSTAIMAKRGVGPCGSFCDTGSFCTDSKKCGCNSQVPQCPLQNRLAYQLIKPEEIKNLFKQDLETDKTAMLSQMEEDGAEILLNTLPSGYIEMGKGYCTDKSDDPKYGFAKENLDLK
jgi:hypothetical protein